MRTLFKKWWKQIVSGTATAIFAAAAPVIPVTMTPIEYSEFLVILDNDIKAQGGIILTDVKSQDEIFDKAVRLIKDYIPRENVIIGEIEYTPEEYKEKKDSLYDKAEGREKETILEATFK